MQMKLASVLLAAGGGSRFRATETTHKLLALGVDGRAVVEHSFASMATHAGGDPLVVVSGAVELPDLAGAHVVPNIRWAEGQSTSLWEAIDLAEALECEGIVVGLGDQPGISADDWSAVRSAMRAGAAIAVATYGGKRRNPVGLARSVWPLLPKIADEGARSVMQRHPELVIEVPCTGNSDDIDSVEDLLRWHLS
jgi:molybdenum cofactor cytidylyltransferase